MKPMLDPQRDLKGATPETLVRTLLKCRQKRSRLPASRGIVLRIWSNLTDSRILYLVANA